MSQIVKVQLPLVAVLGTAFGLLALAAQESRAESTPTPLQAPAAATPPDAELCNDKNAPPGFTPAALKTRTPPEFPDTDVSDENEGWVRLGFTIDTEGETKDVVVLDQVGSSAMAKAARVAVGRWKYKAAIQDGRTVEQYGSTAEILFRAPRVGNAPIHDAVVAKYDEGRNLAGQGKYTEGIAVLEQTFSQSLTLYEQAKISFALAFAYEKSNDAPRALMNIRHALIERGTFLEKAVVPAAQRMRIRLEVANGNLHYAACAAPLPAADKFDPNGADRSQTQKIVEDVKKRLSSPAPLTVDATLIAKAAGSDGGVWEHPLSRHKFKFLSFTGLADELRLSCVRQMTQGTANETTQWTVPPQTGPCVLRVFGSVGATFKLVEEW